MTAGHLQRRRSVGAGQPRGRRERGHQPRVVPAVQRAERHHGLRLPRRVELQLDAGHAEPSDRRGASSTSSPTRSAKTQGHAGRRILESSIPYDPSRTYGVLRTDRTHILNVSWNAFLPDGARGSMDNAVRPRRCSTAGSSPASRRWRAASRSGSASPVMRRRRRSLPPTSARPTCVGPRATAAATHWRRSTRAIRALDGKDVGEKILDINCIAVPAFGENGELVPPYNIRTPTRMQPRPDAVQELRRSAESRRFQFRVGFFNLFNQAFANDEHRRRHQPDAGHDMQRAGERARRRGRHARTCATRRRASPTRRRRWTTSARST